jgi:hypothetical protein
MHRLDRIVISIQPQLFEFPYQKQHTPKWVLLVQQPAGYLRPKHIGADENG